MMSAVKHFAAAATALTMTLAAPLAAQARPFAITNMTLNIAQGSSVATVLLPGREEEVKLTTATSIEDGAFTKIDLKIVLDSQTADDVQKMVDQGFTSEPSGCAPGQFGPLDMEDGLRYFFEIDLRENNRQPLRERVRGTIYPGNRSTHWTNDVFCEYDPALGDDYAVLRFTGFFFVIHRTLGDRVDIQLRPVTLTDAEIQAVYEQKQLR